MDIDKLMAETSEHYEREKQQLHVLIKQLRAANRNLRDENKALRRSANERRKREQRQHYKNGKRGGKFNG